MTTAVEAFRNIVAEVEETEKNNTRNAGTDYRARAFIRDHGADALRKAEYFDILRAAMGYVENGSDTVLKVYQDDATRDWFVHVGQRHYWGHSLSEALEHVKADLDD